MVFQYFFSVKKSQVLELDDLHLLSRSTQAHLNISLILQQYVVRSHGIRFHHTYHLIHEQYLSQILFTHLASSWSKICHVSALIICRSFKRTTCTSRIFSKINAMFLPLSFCRSIPAYFARFKSSDRFSKNSTSFCEKSNSVKNFCFLNFASCTTPL